MYGFRAFVLCAVVTSFAFISDSASAALAKKNGGSGYSGTLSNNKAIRKQQLIADPDDPIKGSTSVSYNPAVVSLSGLIFGPGYTGSGFVEVTDDGNTFLQPLTAFLAGPAGVETGYVQVFYDTPVIITGPPAAAAAPVHGQINPPTGYTTVDNDGPFGVDTHALFFDYLSTVPDSAVAKYTIYADTGNRDSDNSADFMEGFDGAPFRLEAGDIASATVQASLNAVPLPAAVWAGGLMLGGVAVARRFKVARL